MCGVTGHMEQHDVHFEIALTETQAAAIRALGDKPVDVAMPSLAKVAVAEWLDWLVADDRPASLTEVSKRRVKALIDAGLLPQIPTAPVIAQRARLTLGQARYIVASLALENPGATAEARDGLLGRLRAALTAAGVANPSDLTPSQIRAISTEPTSVQFDVPKNEADLATATHEELLNARFSASKRLEIDEFEPPSRKRRTDSYVQLTLRPHVAVEILQQLERAGRPDET
jgi:hypothetical protein